MSWLENMRRDVIHAWRMIRRMPGVAAVMIISLGIGIGVNTAVFSWIQAVWLQPLPGVQNSGNLILIEPRAENGGYPSASWLEYRDLSERLGGLRDIFAFRMAPFNVGETGHAERTYGLLVSGNYFSALRLQPEIGRLIGAADTARPGGEAVAVISYGYWQSHFGGLVNVIGKTFRANNQQLAVIGVAPEKFQGTVIGIDFDMWVPATMAPVLISGSRELEDRDERGYSLMARYAGGVTRSQAQAELDGAMQQLARDFPATNRNLRAELLPIYSSPRGPQRFLVRAVATLQGVMLLLLLAVCGNTANLLLARASARQREMAVRMALGSGRWRIVSLLTSESLMLALFGVALGIPVAVWGSNVFRAVEFIGAIPIRFQTGVDATGLAFATLLGIGCGLVFGVAPALQLARVNPQLSFRAGSGVVGRSGLRNAFMGMEVALALVVLVAAGLFLRSFRETRDTDPGFRREGVLLAAYDFTGRPVDAASSLEFARRLQENLRVLPGVESVAIATSVPLDIHGLPSRAFTLEGRARSDANPDRALTNTVTPGYFELMTIPLLAGTDFAGLRDPTAPPQAIVNQEFVRRYVGADIRSADAIGRHLEIGGNRYVIIGVARNSLYDSFGEPPTPAIYFSYRDRPAPMGEIHVRALAGDGKILANEIRRVAREIDPSLPIYDVRTLGEHIEKNLLFRRIPARMFVVLGPLLLVLAAIGIFAVVSYAVSHRTTEIGIRMALGAAPGRVVLQIVSEAMSVIVIGAAAGWAVGYGIAVTFAGNGAVTLPVFAGVPALLLAVGALACWLPARRATLIEPVVALRHD